MGHACNSYLPLHDAIPLQCLPRPMPCSSAGDALVTGSAVALMNGSSPLKALAFGIAAAKYAVQSKANVPVDLSLAYLEADASEALKSTSEYRFERTNMLA